MTFREMITRDAIGAVRAWCRLRHGAAVTITAGGDVWTARYSLTVPDRTRPDRRAMVSGRIRGDRLRDVLGATVAAVGAGDRFLALTRYPRVSADVARRSVHPTLRPDGAGGWTATGGSRD